MTAPDVLGTRERARVRLNEENRVKRACETLEELARKHLSDARLMELHAFKSLLLHAIRNQHLLEGVSRKRKGLEGVEGF